ncbi:MAG: TonB family protein [Deltaproteobacteria bacterium]|nr:TonB family protein [Deltaproteobacteria bacterium]MBW2585573.1 TonB family protein [Deltaproteobacteria bacterium]
MSESSHNTSVAFSVYDGDALLSSETLSQEIIKIGRLQTSDIRLDDEKVSRMHAVIEVTGPGEVFIIDLGSASGTLVNGEKINKRKLQTGDEVQVGNKRLHLDIITGTVAVASSPPVAMAAGGGRATPVVDERAMTAMLDEESEPRAKAVSKASEPEDESGPKFNPFAVGAQRLSRTPFANAAAEEGPEYGLVATTAALPAHEIETNERAIEVSVIWGERNVLNVDYLTPPRDYYVGEPNGEDVDYVLGHDAIGVDRMPLCVAQGAGVAAIVPEGAKGEATIGDQTRSFDLMRGQGDFRPSSTIAGAMEFPVPEGGSVRMKHRDFTFIVKDVKAGKKVAGHAKIDVRPMIYVAGAALFASLVLTMFYFQPPRPRGLSSDLLSTDSRLIQFLMEPEELEEPEPEWLNGDDSSGGGTGKAHEGEQGQMGDEKSEKNKNKYGIQGPEDNPDPVMAREQAEDQAKTAGVIGTLKSMMGSFNAPTSPYGADFALGNDATSALGAMTGNDIGQNFGFGGLGLRGTGRGGGGLGQGTIGMGNFGTIGRGGGRGDGEGGYGRGVGGFRGRAGGVPQVRSGGAEVRGSLSKEVIRRVVRRHINEVKFCYEQQLNARPDLQGRVTTKFVISPTGSVQSAMVGSSSLRNEAVESCIVRAVRRWTFPAPDGGGVVVVNYPFLLDAAGQ